MASATNNVSVLADAKYVTENSRNVRVIASQLPSAAAKLIEGFKRESYSAAKWRQHPMHPKELTAETVNWIFIVDLLNFSFWMDDGTSFAVDFEGDRHTGYFALCACLNRALQNGVPITSASFLENASDEVIAAVFQSTYGVIPMLEERISSLRSAATSLQKHFNGSFVNVVKESSGSAQSLISLVLEHFPTFRDCTTYNSRTVYILKRAQILVADIWACFEGQSFGFFRDIDTITMFADYRVPQALLILNVLEYSPQLLERLARQEILLSGDPDEVEIRACSIWVVELLRQTIQSLDGEHRPDINAITIDFYLWDFTKSNPEAIKALPFHRTRSVFY